MKGVVKLSIAPSRMESKRSNALPRLFLNNRANLVDERKNSGSGDVITMKNIHYSRQKMYRRIRLKAMRNKKISYSVEIRIPLYPDYVLIPPKLIAWLGR